MIKQNMELKRWTSDTISEITEIHTLINAIHQQSILDFKETIKNIMEVGNQAIKTIVASHQNPEQNRGYYDTDSSVKTALKLYDLSEDKTNPDILDFIGRLSLLRLPFQKMGSFNEYQIEDFVCKDDFLVWTTRLYAHSVDIFMNFSESEKNIIISYNESSRKRGNAERVRYFETVLKKLGFFVETDTELSLGEQNGVCSLKATLSADYGLNEYTDFVEVATKVVSLFSHSVMLDWDLEAIIDTYSEDYFYESFDKLVKKFEAGDIWYGYAPTSQNSFDKGKLVDLPQRVRLDNTLFRQILQYLQLPVPDFISESSREYLDQPALDKYNNIIERSFAVGRIFIDKDGILKRDEKYNVVSFLAQAISEKEEEFLYNSRLINLLPYNKLNFKTVGYVGDFVAVSGYMKLQNGKYLSVKGLINPATKRMKYSTVELVSVSGRESLSSDKLLQILQEEGFDVSAQEKVSKTEQLKIAETLHKNVQVTDSLETRGTPTSSGNATYVAGRITFNRDKVDKNSILVVPYTTPDDVERIKVAKAILTTGGGVLSHAAITTREYGTPSAIIDGTWKNYGLDILYYLPFGDPLTVDGLSIRTVEEKHKLLKEGSVVLVNGETGHVLLFDDLNENLNSLQNAIDKDDAATISQILSVNTGNKNIGRLIEYVYFQAVGDAQMANTLNMLFSHKSSVVKNKVKELNKNYIHSKILNIEEAMENIKTIEDINIAYSVLGTISDKLNFIKTPEENPDIVLLREKFVKLKEEMDFKYLKYIKELIAKCDALLLQKQFSDSDIAEIVNILQKAKVYNLFVDEKESDIQLQNFMYQLTHKLAVLEIKMRVSLEAKEKKSIVSLDNIQDGDVFSFGSKTTELAKIRRLLKDKENVVV
ncbi:MAG: hypothetical protein II816_02080, partial [Elusimicrobia bacterium]|nr:hypothetical protein [Elusimicrobiota bacterium]